PGQKAEGSRPQGAPTGKTTAPVGSREFWRSRHRTHHVAGSRKSSRNGFREPNVRLSSSSPAALRQERAERLRRDRAATLTLRDAFPGVQLLRLELKFEGAAANLPAA